MYDNNEYYTTVATVTEIEQLQNDLPWLVSVLSENNTITIGKGKYFLLITVFGFRL